MERDKQDESTLDREADDEEWDATSTMIFPAPAIHKAKPQSTPSRPIVVEVIGGPMDGTRRGVIGSMFTIGRGSHNELALALDQTVSTRHVCIHGNGEQYWLEDLGSRNGTWVGDKRLEERILIGPGARFRVGQTEVEFMPT